MKHLFLFLLLTVTLFTQTYAQSDKDKWRLKHIVKEMKMTHDLSMRFTPVFYAYMKEVHEAKDIYANLKEKYHQEIEQHKLTPEHGKELLESHWTSDEQVLIVRRKYTKLFSKLLSSEHVFRVFSLANDKVK